MAGVEKCTPWGTKLDPRGKIMDPVLIRCEQGYAGSQAASWPAVSQA